MRGTATPKRGATAIKWSKKTCRMRKKAMHQSKISEEAIELAREKSVTLVDFCVDLYCHEVEERGRERKRKREEERGRERKRDEER